MDKKQVVTTLLRDGFILAFNQDKLDVVETAKAVKRAGLNNMEVTCRIVKPVEKIRQLREALPDFVIGVASLIDNPEFIKTYNGCHDEDPLPTVDEIVAAGASYFVSAAIFRKETYQKYAGKLPMIPGCGTVSEIVAQFSLGANFAKVFPAKQLGGLGFVKAIDAPIHKMISLLPMGGTNEANIPEYIDAEILVVGGSFSVIDKEMLNKIIENQDYKLLSTELAKIKKIIDQTRAKKWPQIDFKTASVKQISEITGRNFNL